MPLDNPQSLTQRNQIPQSVEEFGWQNSVQHWHKAECLWQAELTMIATNTAYLAFSDYHVRHSALPVIVLQLLCFSHSILFLQVRVGADEVDDFCENMMAQVSASVCCWVWGAGCIAARASLTIAQH